MKLNHYAVEFKNKVLPLQHKFQILLHSGVTGMMELILGDGRKKRSNCTWYGG
jgi:hypothetical protein